MDRNYPNQYDLMIQTDVIWSHFLMNWSAVVANGCVPITNVIVLFSLSVVINFGLVIVVTTTKAVVAKRRS